MIKCEICQRVFKSLITGKHLKTHGITSAEYKEKYGQLASDEYRALKRKQNGGKNNPNYGNKLSEESKKKISESKIGKIPHNKGKPMSDEQKKKLSQLAIERNEHWHESGTHPIVGRKHTSETKQKIREKRLNQTIHPESYVKAVETKRNLGYDLAFFRGKKHTPETKKKISEISKKYAAEKKEKSIDDAKVRLANINYTLVSIEGNIANIRCNVCGNMLSRTRQNVCESKLKKTMCYHCYPPLVGTSNAEKELANFIKKHSSIEINNRNILGSKEIDIFVPEKNIGFEYNGLYWHSDVYKDKTYHLEKRIAAAEKNINLIHIFEDEWVEKKEIVKSRILSLLGKTPNKIHARKCNIKEIDSRTANLFLNANHIQGSGRSNVRLGLYYDEKLVSVMSFLKNDISKNITGWELNRFCSLLNTQISGGANKLFRYFIKKYDPEEITSFCDLRWAKVNTVYASLGFEHCYDTPPNYWYFMRNEVKRYHRYTLRKTEKSTLTERELREKQGYLRIYDCGSSKWIWKKAG